LTELHLILEKTVMIRRLKKDILPELPKKQRKKVLLDLSGEEYEQLHQEIKQFNSLRNKDDKPNLLMELWAKTGMLKVPAISEYILQLIKDSKKFIIFAHHQEVMNSLENCLKTAHVNLVRIDGSTKSEERNHLVNKFQQDIKCQVAILSITACGTGITLTAASIVVFAELYWTPGILIQAEDRAHRIGKTGELEVHYLLGKNTVDDRIWSVVEHKLEVVGETLDGEQEELIPSIRNYANLLSEFHQSQTSSDNLELQKPSKKRTRKSKKKGRNSTTNVKLCKSKT